MSVVPKVKLSSGYEMPAIGLGMFLARDEAEVRSSVRAAIEAGYRHIDTAFSYRNESFIGNALRQLFDEGTVKREDLFLTTKLPPNGMRPENVSHFFRKSLQELQTEYVDLYLVHFPAGAQRTDDDYAIFPTKDGLFDGDPVDIVHTWKALEKLVSEGHVRSIGLSNCNSDQIRRVYEAATIKPSVLQVECHAYLPQVELLKLCGTLDIAMTAYSPIGAPGSVGQGEARLLDDEALKPICQKHGKSPAQVLLRFLVQRGIVVIPKSSNPKRLRENLQIFDFSLSSEEMLSMGAMATGRRYFTFQSYAGMEDQPEYPFKIPY